MLPLGTQRTFTNAQRLRLGIRRASSFCNYRQIVFVIAVVTDSTSDSNADD